MLAGTVFGCVNGYASGSGCREVWRLLRKWLGHAGCFGLGQIAPSA